MGVWEVFWTVVMATVVLLLLGGIMISFITQYRQAEPAEKYWKSLYHIHNPPEELTKD